MKILAFTDLHIGKKGSDDFFLDLDRKVIDRICQDAIDKQVDKIVFLGDLVHTRGEISQKALMLVRYFFDSLDQLDIPIIMILGNHDLFYNTSKDISYLKIFTGLFKNIQMVENFIEDGDCLYVGWLQSAEELSQYNAILKKFKFIFGHFAFAGVPLNDRYFSEGYENQQKDGYIFSGHFHRRSINKKLIYISSPYPYTWDGKNDDAYGYCLIDTSAEQIDFENLHLFAFKEYNFKDIFDQNSLSKQDIENKEIRVLINEEISDEHLMSVRARLNAWNPKSLKFEKNYEKELVKLNEKVLAVTPNEFIKEYIEKLDIKQDQKNRILKKIEKVI